MPCFLPAARQRQVASICAWSTSVTAAPCFSTGRLVKSRTKLMPCLAMKLYMRSICSGVILATPDVPTSVDQNRTGVPSPSTKPLPSAESLTKPFSPAAFSFR